MSSAPLNRDQQITLMTGASQRLDALLSKWDASPTIKGMMMKRHPAIDGSDDYTRHDERLVKVG